MSMEVYQIHWIAGQLENIAKSMTDSLKNRSDLGEPVDNHHIETSLNLAHKLVKEAINKHYPIIDPEFATTYDPNYGDNVLCFCGHTYYRHFNSSDNLSQDECKFCGCSQFEEAEEVRKREQEREYEREEIKRDQLLLEMQMMNTTDDEVLQELRSEYEFHNQRLLALDGIDGSD